MHHVLHRDVDFESFFLQLILTWNKKASRVNFLCKYKRIKKNKNKKNIMKKLNTVVDRLSKEKSIVMDFDVGCCTR